GGSCAFPRPEEPMNRRELCRVLGAAVASPALSRLSANELWAVGRRAHARGPGLGFRVLDPHQAETVEMIAELIIPETDTHGRRGVPGRVRAVRTDGPLARGAGGLLMAAPSFDAIVVGSGITGGWAAKELCERGLKTLVLEAGRPIDPARDYVEHVPPWEMKF